MAWQPVAAGKQMQGRWFGENGSRKNFRNKGSYGCFSSR